MIASGSVEIRSDFQISDDLPMNNNANVSNSFHC